MAKRSRFQVGMVVEARAVITDKDQHGRVYIHAAPGTLGTVVGMQSDGADEWPAIAWGPQGHGVCDTPPTVLEVYAGAVFCVVE